MREKLINGLFLKSSLEYTYWLDAQFLFFSLPLLDLVSVRLLVERQKTN